jgi:hypothetical protein
VKIRQRFFICKSFSVLLISGSSDGVVKSFIPRILLVRVAFRAWLASHKGLPTRNPRGDIKSRCECFSPFLIQRTVRHTASVDANINLSNLPKENK